MTDKEIFLKELNAFFDSKDTVTLITGIDDDNKIRQVLNELNKRYRTGTMYVNSVTGVGELLNMAFGYDKKIVPRQVTQTKPYTMFNMKLSFKKYSKNLGHIFLSENDDFAIYYPVQIALLDETLFKQLVSHIEATKAPKTIIVTTNDQYTETSKLDPFIHQHIHYKIKNDNEDLYKIVKNNLNNPISDLKMNPIYKELID